MTWRKIESEADLPAERLRPLGLWGSIDTAPRDGSEILAWKEDVGIMLVRWTCCAAFMTDAEIEECALDENEAFLEDWFCADFVHGCRLQDDLVPTHWMPLPPGPGEHRHRWVGGGEYGSSPPTVCGDCGVDIEDVTDDHR